MPTLASRGGTWNHLLLCVRPVTNALAANALRIEDRPMKAAEADSSTPWQHGIAAGLALLLAGAFLWLAFGSWQGFHEGVDHNQAPFEDFSGPYLTQIQALADAQGWQTGYMYPPTFALLLQPLASLSILQASWVWLGILLLASALLGWCGWLWLRPCGVQVTFAYSLLAALSFPWLHDMHWGQVSTLVWALTLGALTAWRAGYKPVAWLALSLAIAIKVFPALFLLGLWFAGERKGVLWMVGLTAAWLIALPAALMGWGPTWTFYADVSAELSRRGPDKFFSGQFWGPRMTQFMPAVLSRAWGGAHGVWLLLAWAIPAGLLVAVLVGAYRRLRSTPHGLGWVLLTCALPLLISPSWIHYFVWLPWALFAVWQASSHWMSRAWCGAGMILASAPLYFAVGGNPTYGLAGLPLVATLLVLTAIWSERKSPISAQTNP